MATKQANAIKKPKKANKLDVAQKHALFKELIEPKIDFIKSLTRQYTHRYQDIEDNYNHCLAQFFNYIGTYKRECKLDTWIHIVVKRACFNKNKERCEEASHWTDIEMCSKEDLYGPGNSLTVEATCGTLLDNLSDHMVTVLTMINPLRLSPFMLHVQGHKIREITDMEWKMGHLEKKSEGVVKSRIFFAKKELQYLLRKHGITKRNY